MKTSDWIFYTDASGNHRWQRLGDDGSVAVESRAAFASCVECINDASEHGYSLYPLAEKSTHKPGA